MKRIFKLIISLSVHGVDQLNILFHQIVGNKIYPKFIVLYYHSVKNIQRERFALQLDEILRCAKPFSLDLKHPFYDGLHHVAITFDDGFISLLQNALPELMKRNMPFSVFVPTGYVGKSPSWIKDADSYQLKHEDVMNQYQLRELKKLKIAAIGSHCVTHRNLINLTLEDAKQEIFRSKTVLEDILAQKIKSLSFPHGGHSQAHIEFAKQAGYERVFSITPALAFGRRGEYVTGRVKVDPDDWMLEFHLKIYGAYRWLQLAFAVKKVFLRIFAIFFRYGNTVHLN